MQDAAPIQRHIPSSPKPLVIFLLIRLGTIPHHLPQLVFLDELAVQNAEVIDQVFAALHQRRTRGDGAVGLNAEFELTDQGTVISGKSSGFGYVCPLCEWEPAHLTRG